MDYTYKAKQIGPIIYGLSIGDKLKLTGSATVEATAEIENAENGIATWKAVSFNASGESYVTAQNAAVRVTATTDCTLTVTEGTERELMEYRIGSDVTSPGKSVSGVVDPVTGVVREFAGGKSVLRPVALSHAFRAAKDNNARTNAVATTAVVAFGATPAAGTLGYATSAVVTTGWRSWITNSATNSIQPFRAYGGSPVFLTYYVQGTSYNSANGVRRSAAAMEISVRTNAPEPVITVVGYSSQYKIKVDGKRCQPVVSPSGGGLFDLSLNLRGFGAGFHTITLILNQDDSVAGFKIPKSYQAFPPEKKPLVLLFTDSLGFTSPDTGGQDCFAAVMGDYLGAEVRLFGAGGSSYDVIGTSETFIDRIDLAAAMITRDPDLVLFAGGINTPGAGSADFQGIAEATIAKAAQKWPATIGLFGSWAANNTSSQTDKIALEAKLKAAASAQGAVFIPVMTDPRGPWIDGTGTIESPAGDGTADALFSNADLTHWAGVGHLIIGQRAAYAVAEAFWL